MAVLEKIQSRPILRYHGGKWKLGSWILSHFPSHTRYVESYCGAANLLLKKDRAYAEIINDLNHEIINLFTVLQNSNLCSSLFDLVSLTPYARQSFLDAKIPTAEPVEKALNFLIRSHMGFNAASPNTGFRSNSTRTSSIPAHNWANISQVLEITHARLKGVIIESRPAVDVMQQHDSKDTLIFADPPYLPDVRSASSQYVNDMTYNDHWELIECLNDLKSMVVLCGYSSNLYHAHLDCNGWRRIEKQTYTANKKKRIECIWLNPLCQERLALENQ